eukprot:TRINITY_DN9975_c0_g2_i2.p1 TRINITY_DN9975_c0_g2~~TRINITY_DN9975_c0_g2_i2.p1  ORF type:complete len:234 (+),score=36.81 TRINITY_DN9975_c0_g2_i2:74-775(+)
MCIRDRGRVKAAETLKERGNEHFKKQEYDQARLRYELGIRFIEKDNNGELNDLRLGYYLNLAMTYIKIGENELAVDFASRAIELNPMSLKAWYRRAMARENLGQLKLAIEDCAKAKEIDINDYTVTTTLKRLEKKYKNASDEEKTVYKKMFGGSSQDMTRLQFRLFDLFMFWSNNSCRMESYPDKPRPFEMMILNRRIRTRASSQQVVESNNCLLYTSPSPRDGLLSRMPSSA